jgi:hypothetical protein
VIITQTIAAIEKMSVAVTLLVVVFIVFVFVGLVPAGGIEPP